MLSNCGVGEDCWQSLGLQGEQTSQSKWNQSWIFIGRTDAEVPIVWPSDIKNWLIRKDPDSGKDWGQEEKGTTEDEMVGWHHGLDGQEFEHPPGAGDEQGKLVCCSPWGCKESDMTEWLNWTRNTEISIKCICFLSFNSHALEIQSLWKGTNYAYNFLALYLLHDLQHNFLAPKTPPIFMGRFTIKGDWKKANLWTLKQILPHPIQPSDISCLMNIQSLSPTLSNRVVTL